MWQKKSVFDRACQFLSKNFLPKWDIISLQNNVIKIILYIMIQNKTDPGNVGPPLLQTYYISDNTIQVILEQYDRMRTNLRNLHCHLHLVSNIFF